jgi:hypothetical protein
MQHPRQDDQQIQRYAALPVAMNLLERIDIALQHARKTRGDLAEAIGVSTAALSNLKRRPGSWLKPDKVARAGRFMQCDIYWLCTGEGGKYVPAMKPGAIESHSFLVAEVAKWLEGMTPAEQALVFATVYQLKHGHPPQDTPSIPSGHGPKG